MRVPPASALQTDELDFASMFGQHALEGSTTAEKRAVQVGYVLTVILTGSNVCLSLTNTAQTGGC